MTSNLDVAREAMFKAARQLGETEGRGAVSRSVLGIQMVEYSSDGRATVVDAEQFYDDYMGGNEDIQEGFGGSKDAKKGNGRKQNVSKFRQFLKLGTNKKFDPVAVIHDGKDVAAEERAKGTTSLSPFDALLEIVRMQNKGEFCEEPLTKDQMRMALQKKVRADKSEADMLWDQKKKLEKVSEVYPSAEVDTAIDELTARIEELGGTTAQQKAKAKAEAAAAKKAAKQGQFNTASV